MAAAATMAAIGQKRVFADARVFRTPPKRAEERSGNFEWEQDLFDGNIPPFDSAEFQNWSDFEIYDAAIRAGLRVGEIVPVEEPAWYIPPTSEIGHAACFQRL